MCRAEAGCFCKDYTYDTKKNKALFKDPSKIPAFLEQHLKALVDRYKTAAATNDEFPTLELISYSHGIGPRDKIEPGVEATTTTDSVARRMVFSLSDPKSRYEFDLVYLYIETLEMKRKKNFSLHFSTRRRATDTKAIDTRFAKAYSQHEGSHSRRTTSPLGEETKEISETHAFNQYHSNEFGHDTCVHFSIFLNKILRAYFSIDSYKVVNQVSPLGLLYHESGNNCGFLNTGKVDFKSPERLTKEIDEADDAKHPGQHVNLDFGPTTDNNFLREEDDSPRPGRRPKVFILPKRQPQEGDSPNIDPVNNAPRKNRFEDDEGTDQEKGRDQAPTRPKKNLVKPKVDLGKPKQVDLNKKQPAKVDVPNKFIYKTGSKQNPKESREPVDTRPNRFKDSKIKPSGAPKKTQNLPYGGIPKPTNYQPTGQKKKVAGQLKDSMDLNRKRIAANKIKADLVRKETEEEADLMEDTPIADLNLDDNFGDQEEPVDPRHSPQQPEEEDDEDDFQVNLNEEELPLETDGNFKREHDEDDEEEEEVRPGKRKPLVILNKQPQKIDNWNPAEADQIHVNVVQGPRSEQPVVETPNIPIVKPQDIKSHNLAEHDEPEDVKIVSPATKKTQVTVELEVEDLNDDELKLRLAMNRKFGNLALSEEEEVLYLEQLSVVLRNSKRSIRQILVDYELILMSGMFIEADSSKAVFFKSGDAEVELYRLDHPANPIYFEFNHPTHEQIQDFQTRKRFIENLIDFMQELELETPENRKLLGLPDKFGYKVYTDLTISVAPANALKRLLMMVLAYHEYKLEPVVEMQAMIDGLKAFVEIKFTYSSPRKRLIGQLVRWQNTDLLNADKKKALVTAAIAAFMKSENIPEEGVASNNLNALCEQMSKYRMII